MAAQKKTSTQSTIQAHTLQFFTFINAKFTNLRLLMVPFQVLHCWNNVAFFVIPEGFIGVREEFRLVSGVGRVDVPEVELEPVELK